MINTKIDLVIPLFNKKNHIIRCFDSAINQQRKKFNKIIIVNDGSTDGVEKLLTDLKYKHSNLLIINQDNKGVSSARNEGVKKSNADYIVFLDADDELSIFYLHEIYRLISKFEKQDIKIFSTSHNNIFDNNYFNNNYFERKSNLKIFTNPLLNISLNKTILCASGICLKKDLIEKNLFPENIKIGEDIYVWEKILLNEKLAWSSQKLIYIYKNAENRSQELNDDIPYYILQYDNFYKEIKILKKKIAFIFFHVLSLFIIINQFKSKKILDSRNFNTISENQNSLIKFFCYIFKLNIVFYFYRITVLVKKNINNLQFLPILIYLLITPTAPIMFLLLFLKRQNEEASLFLLYSSFISLLLFFSSFQNRLYLYQSYPRYSLNYIISFRLFCSLLIYLFITIGFLLFKNLENFYLFLFCLNSLLLFWISELILLRFEKFLNNRSILSLFIFIVSYYLLIILVPFNSKHYFLISLIFILTFFIFSYISFSIKAKKYIQLVKKKIILHYAFYFFCSGILFSSSNFLFRFILTENISLVILSYYFLIFSMATLPSSLYYTVIGQYSLTSKSIRNLYFVFIHIVLLIFFIILNFYFQNVLPNSLNLYILSFLGSILLLYGHIYRAQLISKMLNPKNILFRDFIFFFIAAISPMIVLINNEYLPYLIFINGLTSTILFSFNLKLNSNEKHKT